MLMKSHLLHLKFTQRDQTCSRTGCIPSSTAAEQSSCSILNAGTNTEAKLSSFAREHTEQLSVLFPRIFKKMRFLKALWYSSWKENTQTHCPCGSRMESCIRAVIQSRVCTWQDGRVLLQLLSGRRAAFRARAGFVQQQSTKPRETNVPLPFCCLDFANAALASLILLFWVNTLQPKELLQLRTQPTPNRFT